MSAYYFNDCCHFNYCCWSDWANIRNWTDSTDIPNVFYVLQLSTEESHSLISTWNRNWVLGGKGWGRLLIKQNMFYHKLTRGFEAVRGWILKPSHRLQNLTMFEWVDTSKNLSSSSNTSWCVTVRRFCFLNSDLGKGFCNTRYPIEIKIKLKHQEINITFSVLIVLKCFFGNAAVPVWTHQLLVVGFVLIIGRDTMRIWWHIGLTPNVVNCFQET